MSDKGYRPENIAVGPLSVNVALSTLPTIGSIPTFEARLRYPPDLWCASLAHAHWNIHHCFTRRPSLALVEDQNARQKRVWRAEIVLLSAGGRTRNENMRQDRQVEDRRPALAAGETVSARRRRTDGACVLRGEGSKGLSFNHPWNDRRGRFGGRYQSCKLGKSRRRAHQPAARSGHRDESDLRCRAHMEFERDGSFTGGPCVRTPAQK